MIYHELRTIKKIPDKSVSKMLQDEVATYISGYAQWMRMDPPDDNEDLAVTMGGPLVVIQNDEDWDDFPTTKEVLDEAPLEDLADHWGWNDESKEWLMVFIATNNSGGPTAFIHVDMCSEKMRALNPAVFVYNRLFRIK